MPRAAHGELGGFPATPWTELILPAANGSDRVDRAALLDELLKRYLPALRVHLLARGVRRDEADDLLQGFVAAKILRYDLVGRADRARGRFRSFLCKALDRYLIDEGRRRRPTQSLEEMEFGPLAGEGGAAADGFDVAWAREVIAATIARMREECEAANDPRVWAVFDRRLLSPAMQGKEPPSYQELVTEFGFTSPVQASNLLITAKRRFERCLRAVIAPTVGSAPEEVDREINDLLIILDRSCAE